MHAFSDDVFKSCLKTLQEVVRLRKVQKIYCGTGFKKKKMGMKKRKRQDGEEDFEFDPTPRHLVEAHIKEQEKRLIVVLEGAQLESIAVS